MRLPLRLVLPAAVETYMQVLKIAPKHDMKSIPKNVTNRIHEGATFCCPLMKNSDLELGSSKTSKQDGYGSIRNLSTNNSNYSSSEYELMKVKSSKYFPVVFRFRNKE